MGNLDSSGKGGRMQLEQCWGSLDDLQRELDIEQRILDAARRMSDMPASSKKEKQKRKQMTQQ